MKKPLSLYHPLLYKLRVFQRRLFRTLHWQFSGRRYTKYLEPRQRLDYRYIKHTSKLIRRLGNSDIALQYNKVINLQLAIAEINGVIIEPGEYFSFCLLVGKPTKKRGFLEGMELSFGQARKGIGGGICQLSNLIHWMAIHSPLNIIERANHSFDPFPDEGRVLPFGSGAAIFYNFVDLVIYNPTTYRFQLMFNLTEHQLEGELLCSHEREAKYHIYEKAHCFIKSQGRVYRENEIWRDIFTKGHGPQLLSSQCLYQNRVIVKYPVDESKITCESIE